MNKGHVKDINMYGTYEPTDDVYHCMKSSERVIHNFHGPLKSQDRNVYQKF